MAKKTIRVYKKGDYWVAKKPGNQNASFKSISQKEAYLVAKRIALNQNISITVYYENGKKKVIIPKDDQEDDCFITTACVNYFGLQDNCYELTTLRNFRDEYLLNKDSGKEMVQSYYTIAPLLVKKINSDAKRDSVYKEIYTKIVDTCSAIESKDFDRAEVIYIEVVRSLFLKYNFS